MKVSQIRINYFYFLFITVFVSILILSNKPASQNTLPLSPSAMCIADKHGVLIVAQQTGNRIDIIEIKNNEVIGTVTLPGSPKGLAYDGGDIVYVACSHSSGNVYAVDIVNNKIIESIDVGFGACAPVLSPGKKTLYVCNQFSDDISVVDLQRAKEINRIKVLRQPKAMDISPDGRYLFVANFLPATRADIDTVASEVSVIDLKTEQVIKNIPLANGSNALQGLKVSPDGNYVFISHNLGRFQVPTTQLAQGWMNTSALSVLDARGFKYVATILLDEPEKGAANPWGIAMNKEFLFVSHAATHEVSIIRYRDFITKLQETDNKDELSYSLTFLTDIRRRVPLSGLGPRAILCDGETLYAALYFSDAIQKLNIDPDLESIEYKNEDLIVLNPEMLVDSVRLGEIIFHDARHCLQQWQSCASCHPDNGRVDGLNWDLLNDGMGNPKNCKSLLLSHQTPPAMITGIRESAEVAVRAGFKYIQFVQVDEETARAVDLYLQSLKPIPSPYLEKGKLSKKAKKGEEIFNRIGCAECHPMPLFTDMNTYAMGEKSEYDNVNSWDTPTLVETWRTAPYLYDGRCATLYEVFDDQKHGITVPLSQEEIAQLVAYVSSL